MYLTCGRQISAHEENIWKDVCEVIRPKLRKYEEDDDVHLMNTRFGKALCVEVSVQGKNSVFCFYVDLLKGSRRRYSRRRFTTLSRRMSHTRIALSYSTASLYASDPAEPNTRDIKNTILDCNREQGA